MLPKSELLFIISSPLDFCFVYHPSQCIVLYSAQSCAVASVSVVLCCRGVYCTGCHPVSITLPALSQAGSQTTYHQREKDEWWDLGEMHHQKQGSCCDSEH